jgi:hypothetical protein
MIKSSWTIVLATVAACGLPNEAAAQSLGLKGMPSRVCQCFGYGWGAGYHAPLVRTPGVYPQRVPRNVWAAPECGPLYAAAYEPLGCFGQSCYQGQPNFMTPTPMPASPAPPSTVEPLPAAPPVAPVGDRHVRRFIVP